MDSRRHRHMVGAKQNSSEITMFCRGLSLWFSYFLFYFEVLSSCVLFSSLCSFDKSRNIVLSLCFWLLFPDSSRWLVRCLLFVSWFSSCCFFCPFFCHICDNVTFCKVTGLPVCLRLDLLCLTVTDQSVRRNLVKVNAGTWERTSQILWTVADNPVQLLHKEK